MEQTDTLLQDRSLQGQNYFYNNAKILPMLICNVFTIAICKWIDNYLMQMYVSMSNVSR